MKNVIRNIHNKGDTEPSLPFENSTIRCTYCNELNDKASELCKSCGHELKMAQNETKSEIEMARSLVKLIKINKDDKEMKELLLLLKEKAEKSYLKA